MSNLFRDSFNHLLNVFGDPSLGVYYRDTSKAVVNSYGEITGGTVYLIKKCSMRGKVVTDPLEVKTVTDNSASKVEWSTLTAPAVFKCSATDLIKGGVLDDLGNYEPAIDPENPSAGTGTQGLLNMYVMWHNEIYDVMAIQKGIVYGGDLSALYITTAAVFDMGEIAGKADLVIQDNTPVDPPKPPEPNTYNVVVDGVLLGAYAVGATVTLTPPTKDGYEFKGWTSTQVTITNNTFIMPESNVTVTSVWERIPAPVTKYNVTVDGVLLGAYAPGVVVTLTVPTKDGYTFNGWSSEQVTVSDNTFTMPSEDVVVTSLWTAIPDAPVYYVTVVNPNTSVDATQSGRYEVTPYQFEDGSYADPAIQIKSGTYYAMHNFSEWRITSGTGTFSNPKDGDTVFYPTSKETTIECVWTEVVDPRHTVTFVGIDRAAEKVETGETVTVRAPYKEGYEFSKWTAEPSVTFSPNNYTSYVNFTMPDSDVTITANYMEVFYTVNFYLNGDSSDSHALWETLSVKPNTAITAPADPTGSAYAPEDKVFTGWYTAADGGTEFNLAGGVTQDTNLYAHWKGVDRTVTFDTDGGNTIEPRVVEDGMPIGELPVPVKDGFKFVRWTDELGRETITADTIVYYDMTIIAEWEQAVVETGEWVTNKGADVTSITTILYRDKWTVLMKGVKPAKVLDFNQHNFSTHNVFTKLSDGMTRIKGIGGQFYMGAAVPEGVTGEPWSMHFNGGANANANPQTVDGFTAYSRYDGLAQYGQPGSGTGINANSWYTQETRDHTVIAVAYLFAKQAYGEDPTVPGTLFTINGANLFNEPFDQNFPSYSSSMVNTTYYRRFGLVQIDGDKTYRINHIVRLNEPNADGLAWYRLELADGTLTP